MRGGVSALVTCTVLCGLSEAGEANCRPSDIYTYKRIHICCVGFQELEKLTVVALQARCAAAGP